MPKKTGTIRIKWVRSGIGFPRKQNEVVRSIGLQHLNQVVERPDTAHFRGLVAKVCHLVEIVGPSAAPAWAGVPEYKIVPAGAAPKKAAPPVKKPAVKAPVKASVAAEAKVEAPAKKAPASKSRAVKPTAKKASAGSEKPKPKRKAAAPKVKAAAKKESKSKKGKK